MKRQTYRSGMLGEVTVQARTFFYNPVIWDVGNRIILACKPADSVLPFKLTGPI